MISFFLLSVTISLTRSSNNVSIGLKKIPSNASDSAIFLKFTYLSWLGGSVLWSCLMIGPCEKSKLCLTGMLNVSKSWNISVKANVNEVALLLLPDR